MALPINISNLLAGGAVEWARIEFKTSWDAAASLKTICAFANDIEDWGGGYLVIGVASDPDGRPAEVVGVPPERIDATLKDMLNRCRLIQPAYMPITEVADVAGKKVIAVWAPGGATRPYSSPKRMGDKSERVRWIRTMASTIAPSPEQERELFARAARVPFDDRPSHAARVTDLSLPLIEGYLAEVGSSLSARAGERDVAALAQDMNIAEGPPEDVRPKNVGLLFFTMDPERWFPCARIEVVEMPEGEGGDVILERTFRGPIHQQLKDALLHLRNSVIVEEVVKRPDAAESLRRANYPFAALEEALANAVYHKGYDVREPIEVRVLPDRIEVVSHPGADRSVSLEGLKEGRAVGRRYRNRRVGEFLKELRLTEGRNTGFHKIVRALEENGSPPPVFETDEERTYFLVTIFARKATDAPASASAKQRAPLSKAERIGERREAMLALMEADPAIGVHELCRRLGLERGAVARDVRALKDAGRLARVGGSRAGRWRVL